MNRLFFRKVLFILVVLIFSVGSGVGHGFAASTGGKNSCPDGSTKETYTRCVSDTRLSSYVSKNELVCCENGWKPKGTQCRPGTMPKFDMFKCVVGTATTARALNLKKRTAYSFDTSNPGATSGTGTSGSGTGTSGSGTSGTGGSGTGTSGTGTSGSGTSGSGTSGTGGSGTGTSGSGTSGTGGSGTGTSGSGTGDSGAGGSGAGDTTQVGDENNCDGMYCCGSEVWDDPTDGGCCINHELLYGDDCNTNPTCPCTDCDLNCCGSSEYNPDTDLCCGATVHSGQAGRVCCSNGQVKDSVSECPGNTPCTCANGCKTEGCCGSVDYDRTEQRCCPGNVLVDIDESCPAEENCSNPNFQPPAGQICCGTELVEQKEGYICCGEGETSNSSQSPTTFGIPRSSAQSTGKAGHYGPGDACCLGTPYSTADSKCCLEPESSGNSDGGDGGESSGENGGDTIPTMHPRVF